MLAIHHVQTFSIYSRMSSACHLENSTQISASVELASVPPLLAEDNEDDAPPFGPRSVPELSDSGPSTSCTSSDSPASRSTTPTASQNQRRSLREVQGALESELLHQLQATTSGGDRWEHFGLSIADSLRRLPETLAVEAKFEIARVGYEFEKKTQQ